MSENKSFLSPQSPRRKRLISTSQKVTQRLYPYSPKAQAEQNERRQMLIGGGSKDVELSQGTNLKRTNCLKQKLKDYPKLKKDLSQCSLSDKHNRANRSYQHSKTTAEREIADPDSQTPHKSNRLKSYHVVRDEVVRSIQIDPASPERKSRIIPFELDLDGSPNDRESEQGAGDPLEQSFSRTSLDGVSHYHTHRDSSPAQPRRSILKSSRRQSQGEQSATVHEGQSQVQFVEPVVKASVDKALVDKAPERFDKDKFYMKRRQGQAHFEYVHGFNGTDKRPAHTHAQKIVTLPQPQHIETGLMTIEELQVSPAELEQKVVKPFPVTPLKPPVVAKNLQFSSITEFETSGVVGQAQIFDSAEPCNKLPKSLFKPAKNQSTIAVYPNPQASTSFLEKSSSQSQFIKLPLQHDYRLQRSLYKSQKRTANSRCGHQSLQALQMPEQDQVQDASKEFSMNVPQGGSKPSSIKTQKISILDQVQAKKVTDLQLQWQQAQDEQMAPEQVEVPFEVGERKKLPDKSVQKEVILGHIKFYDVNTLQEDTDVTDERVRLTDKASINLTVRPRALINNPETCSSAKNPASEITIEEQKQEPSSRAGKLVRNTSQKETVSSQKLTSQHTRNERQELLEDLKKKQKKSPIRQILLQSSVLEGRRKRTVSNQLTATKPLSGSSSNIRKGKRLDKSCTLNDERSSREAFNRSQAQAQAIKSSQVGNKSLRVTTSTGSIRVSNYQSRSRLNTLQGRLRQNGPPQLMDTEEMDFENEQANHILTPNTMFLDFLKEREDQFKAIDNEKVFISQSAKHSQATTKKFIFNRATPVHSQQQSGYSHQKRPSLLSQLLNGKTSNQSQTTRVAFKHLELPFQKPLPSTREYSFDSKNVVLATPKKQALIQVKPIVSRNNIQSSTIQVPSQWQDTFDREEQLDKDFSENQSHIPSQPTKHRSSQTSRSEHSRQGFITSIKELMHL